jgi:hypothetical protein
VDERRALDAAGGEAGGLAEAEPGRPVGGGRLEGEEREAADGAGVDGAVGLAAAVPLPPERVEGVSLDDRRMEGGVDLGTADEVEDRDPAADYRYRAIASRAEWLVAVAQLVTAIDYDNFKDAVADRQGSKRAALYGVLWQELLRLQQSDGDDVE